MVASARKRSMAAKLLVDRAVRAWKHKFPSAKVDDCAVICLFFKVQHANLTKTVSDTTQLSLNYSELGNQFPPSKLATEDGLETVLNCDISGGSNSQTSRRDQTYNHRTDLTVNRPRRPSRERISVEN